MAGIAVGALESLLRTRVLVERHGAGTLLAEADILLLCDPQRLDDDVRRQLRIPAVVLGLARVGRDVIEVRPRGLGGGAIALSGP